MKRTCHSYYLFNKEEGMTRTFHSLFLICIQIRRMQIRWMLNCSMTFPRMPFRQMPIHWMWFWRMPIRWIPNCRMSTRWMPISRMSIRLILIPQMPIDWIFADCWSPNADSLNSESPNADSPNVNMPNKEQKIISIPYVLFNNEWAIVICFYSLLLFLFIISSNRFHSLFVQIAK